MTNRFPAVLLAILASNSFVYGNEPIIEKVTLERRGQSLSPVDILVPWNQQVQQEALVLDLGADTVVSRKLGSHEPNWTSVSKGTKSMVWLGSGGDIGYIQAFDNDPRTEHVDRAPFIRRIKTSTGEWLADLSIPDSTDADVLLGILPTDDCVFVLSATMEAQKDWPNNKVMKQYRISRIAAPSGNTTWTVSVPAAPEFGYGGPYLLSAKMPNRAVPNVRPLSFIGKNILICAGSKQAIICLEQGSGKQAWKLNRVWEFERGFIGPSVWSHFISRYGTQSFSNGGDRNQVDPKTSHDFEERWSCNIVGGPVVVPLAPNDWNPRPASIFVAVGKSRADGQRGTYGTYLQDCIVYEVSDSGDVVGLTALPRMVTGSQCHVLADGVIWACKNDAFARLRSSGRMSGQGGSFPGSSDLLTNVKWYRELEAVDSEAWLVVGKSGDPMAFTNRGVLRTLTGGYVQKDSRRIVLFPLSNIGYEDGKREDMVLRVPLMEDATLPTTNYSGGANDSIHTLGPYLLAITGLNAERDILSITLGTDKWSAVVTFKIPGYETGQ